MFKHWELLVRCKQEMMVSGNDQSSREQSKKQNAWEICKIPFAVHLYATMQVSKNYLMLIKEQSQRQNHLLRGLQAQLDVAKQDLHSKKQR